MNIYKNDRKSIKVRTIEKEDIPNVVKLVDNETFGCVGLYEDIRPNAADTLDLLEKIVDKETLVSETLIIEENKKFRGYAIVDRITEDRYYISQIAVLPIYRRQGFGTILMNVIKKLAIQDNSIISLNCHSYEGRYFFDNMGVYRERELSANRIWVDEECRIKKEIPPIFPNYEKIKEERERKIDDEIKNFSKFLKSNLGKIINNL